MDATKKGSKWPSYIRKAVNNLQDPKVFTHFMPYKNSPGHPTIKEQKTMAKSLIQFINDTIDW